MKKLGLISVFASTMLLLSFGAVTLSAEDGMGKCGNSKEKMMDRKMMDEEKMKKGKCGTKKEMKYKKNMMDDEDDMHKGMMNKNMMDDDRGMQKGMMNKNMMDNDKCEGKRSEMTKERMMQKDGKKQMKCGVGKCGS